MNRIVTVIATIVLSGSACTLAAAQTSNDIGLLETKLRYSAADSPEFGRMLGSYWAAIGQTHDFSRAHSFFDELASAAPKPNATLLAERASAASAYMGWLYEHREQNGLTDQQLEPLLAGATDDFKQALTLEPDNFAALYGYAVFEGYRPDGKEHQKELLAKLDTLRVSKPYLPWAMVDQLEKTGRIE